MGETWKPIPGWPLYEVSDAGRIASLHRKRRRILNPSTNGHGYQHIQLSREGATYTISVHRIVLEAFIGPRPDGMVACHGDGDRTNNRASNLRWDTQKNNIADKLGHDSHQRGERAGTAKLNRSQVESIRADGRKQRDIASDFGISQLHVSRIKRRLAWAWL